MYKLDKRDREILYALSLNARAPLSEIAKEVKLSKQVVSYRIHNLEEEGIIEAYFAVVNIYRLGIAHYRVHLRYQNITHADEDKLLAYITKHPGVSWVIQLDGDLDLAYIVWATSITEFEKTFDEINARFGHLFKEKHFSVGTRLYHYKHKFLVDREDFTEIVIQGDKVATPFDTLNQKIVQYLSRNGRAPLLEMAEKFGASPKAIGKRVHELIAKRIILGFDVKINYRKLGYTHAKIMINLRDTSPKAMGEIINYLKSLRNVIYITKPVGLYDIEFEILINDTAQFHDTLSNLRYAFSANIKNFNTVFVYYEPKTHRLPFA